MSPQVSAEDTQRFNLLSSRIPALTYLCVSVCGFVHLAVWDSRCVLRLLIRLWDLPVAVDHFYQQPEGQEHEQHIHHDLRVDCCGVCSGCGVQTAAGDIIIQQAPPLSLFHIYLFCVCRKELSRLFFFLGFKLSMLSSFKTTHPQSACQSW